MAFRCAGPCQEQQRPGIQPIRLVTAQRDVIYRFFHEGKEAAPFTEGRETVAEGDFCSSCASSQKSRGPRIVNKITKQVEYKKRRRILGGVPWQQTSASAYR